MRYLDDVVFVKEAAESVYDPVTGTWPDSVPINTEITVNVTDLGTKRSVELFGELKKGAKVIRLQPLFDLYAWDHVLIDGTKYILTTSRKPLGRGTIIVEEVG